jgi:hypothetical protein
VGLSETGGSLNPMIHTFFWVLTLCELENHFF